MAASFSGVAAAKPGVALVGAGALGSVLGQGLAGCGYPIRTVVSRTLAHARDLAGRTGAGAASSWPASLPEGVDLVLCCVPDDAIARVVDELYLLPYDWSRCTVGHTSGALTSEILHPLAERGAATLSFHPVQSFTAASTPAAFEGIYVGLEGSPAGVALGARLAADLGARHVVLPPEAKLRYHLAASIASNFFVTLMALVDEVLADIGFDRYEGRALMRPLVEGTLRNLAEGLPEEVLTGPIARGDSLTVAEHLETLSRRLPHLIPVYGALATEAVRVAVRGGKLAPDQAQYLLDVLHARLEP